ncbi:unnamed protein product [Clonostachys rosea f. rosea IK726]|uniref:Uncharacterized protein n=1 Tax=Clonostachys rosea f. rosea IK726 TaxID=1349383 RepID=A0ACA9TGB0_BIOOC|nr:unnamed protein product [Clonostachys rosea f. rosea IK726]
MSAPSVWLITGASRGLGFEIAKAALKAGHVVVAGRRGYKPTTQITELESLGAKWINLDMKLSNIESIIAGVEKEYGHIDVLVNNAGYGVGGTVEDLSIQTIREVMEVNVMGPIRACRAIIPVMRQQGGGTIVNISSVSGIISYPGISAYSCTKHALEGFTESLSKEIEPFKIRTILVEPGSMPTGFLDTTLSAVTVPRSEPYRGTIADMVLSAAAGGELVKAHGGSPVLAAARIVEAVDRTGVFADRDIGLRLPLGKETQEIIDWGKDLAKRAEELQDIALSIAV